MVSGTWQVLEFSLLWSSITLLCLVPDYGRKYSVFEHYNVSCRLFFVDVFYQVEKERRKKESEVAQSCPILCDPMDYDLPSSSVHGILQARVLEWVAISFSRGSSWPRDWTWVSHILGRCFTIWATREAKLRKDLLIPSFLRIFIRNECWILLNYFSESIEMIIWHFFILVIKMNCVLKQTCLSRIISCLVMMYYSF